jgi:hypothetical protein
MGVEVVKDHQTNPCKPSLFGKIRIQIANFIDWIAKGQQSNLPCTG